MRRGLGRWFERGLLSVMGPPQLGDPSAPDRELAVRAPDLCGRCGGDRDAHEVVRTARLTYTRCPADDPA